MIVVQYLKGKLIYLKLWLTGKESMYNCNSYKFMEAQALTGRFRPSTGLRCHNNVYLIMLWLQATSNHVKSWATRDLKLTYRASQVFIAGPKAEPSVKGIVCLMSIVMCAARVAYSLIMNYTILLNLWAGDKYLSSYLRSLKISCSLIMYICYCVVGPQLNKT